MNASKPAPQRLSVAGVDASGMMGAAEQAAQPLPDEVSEYERARNRMRARIAAADARVSIAQGVATVEGVLTPAQVEALLFLVRDGRALHAQ